MKKTNQVGYLGQPFRANEGISLDVSATNVVGVNGITRTSFGVDLGSAEVPERRYAADVCQVLLVNHEMALTFGQPRVDGKGLRTALIVRMNPLAAAQFVEVIDNLGPPGLIGIVETMRIVQEDLTNIVEEPAQVVEFIANLATIGVAGYESCVDFYYTSPFGYRIAERGKIAIEPVVRVNLRTALFVSVVEKMKNLGMSIEPDRLPQWESA